MMMMIDDDDDDDDYDDDDDDDDDDDSDDDDDDNDDDDNDDDDDDDDDDNDDDGNDLSFTPSPHTFPPSHIYNIIFSELLTHIYIYIIVFMPYNALQLSIKQSSRDQPI